MKKGLESSVLLLVVISLFFPFQFVKAQNLLKERIRKVVSRKTGGYIDNGVFFIRGHKEINILDATRHSYSAQSGEERVVFEFGTKVVPKVYGYFSPNERKVYIDLFNTKIGPGLASLGNSNYVKDLAFYPIDDDSLSIEMEFKTHLQMDVFYLENPGRLVFDIKKANNSVSGMNGL